MKKIMSRIFNDYRGGRVMMLSAVSASTAFGFGGSGRQIWMAAVIGASLSLSGFYLDFLMDLRKDVLSGTPRNPISMGIIPRRSAVYLVIGGTAICTATGVLLNPLVLIPCAAVALVLAGDGIGLLASPFLRAATLGILQGLYALIGAVAAGSPGLPAVFIALFLFFAMTGGRVIGDVRDIEYDEKTESNTIPRVYGMRFTSVFLFANEFAAYAAGFLAFFLGRFGWGYFCCMAAITVFGTGINIFFVSNPEPKRADIANRLSLGVLGGLFVLGMILAGI